VLPYKQLANHVYGLTVFPSPAVYSNPYSNPLIGCSRAVTLTLFNPSIVLKKMKEYQGLQA
jgi:hypothetical protein